MACAVGGDRYAATQLSSKGYKNKKPLPLGRGCPECAVRLLKGSMPQSPRKCYIFLVGMTGQSSRSRLTLGIGRCFPPGRVLAQLGFLPTGMGSEGPWQVGVQLPMGARACLAKSLRCLFRKTLFCNNYLVWIFRTVFLGDQ